MGRSLLFAAGLALAACTPTRLLDRKIAVSVEQFQDLPVPADFRLREDRHQSHSQRIGSEYRYADLVYAGNEEIDDVVSYVIERMPQHAWKLISRQGETTADQVLTFERDVYNARYRVWRTESATMLSVELRTRLRQA